MTNIELTIGSWTAGLRSASKAKIPRLIHQIWNDYDVPEEFADFRESWRSNHASCWKDPSEGPFLYKHKLWTFDAGTDFLARHYPALLRVFYALPKVIQKADLLRYAILHHYGGIYADMDTECLRPFDPLLDGADFVAGYEAKEHPSICNAILCSVPRHPILSAVIRYLEAMPDDRSKLNGKDVGHVFATTGSLMLTPMILAHQTERTRLLPPDAFYPFSWGEKNQCNEEFPGSFAKHYWVSGWYEEGRYRVDEYWNRPKTFSAPIAGGKSARLELIQRAVAEREQRAARLQSGFRIINTDGVEWRQELRDRAARCIPIDYTPRQMTREEIDAFNERLLEFYRDSTQEEFLQNTSKEIVREATAKMASERVEGAIKAYLDNEEGAKEIREIVRRRMQPTNVIAHAEGAD